jgi:aquaporin Z
MTPWGKQSGGHFNPAMTFTFYRLGKVQLWDALFYAAAQFSGAISGVAIATYVLRGAPGSDAVRYAVTVPGVYGNAGAFVAELTISFILMIAKRWHDSICRCAVCNLHNIRNTALWDEHESRTNIWFSDSRQLLARALDLFHCADIRHAGRRGGFSASSRGVAPYCAKLHHANNKRCIFHHGYRTTEAHN